MSMVKRSCTTATLIVLLGAAAPLVVRLAAASAGQTGAAPQQSREDMLALHTKDEKAGSPATGRPLFEQRCGICHRFGGIGKDVGPDLTTIASRFKRRDVLESILWPSKVISDQYQSEMFELSDGKMVNGVLIRETALAVLVRTPDAPDKPMAISKAQIANRTPATVSLMPEGLLDDLKPGQIADLLAFVLAPPPDK